LLENSSRFASTLGFVSVCGAILGCVVLTEIDDNQVYEGASSSSGSSSASSTSSSSSSGMGGMGGMGGEGGAGCLVDVDCPGITNECGKPRCFVDGICGFDNEPIGAPCTENGRHACDGKGVCVECTANVHCASGKCGLDRLCIPPACND